MSLLAPPSASGLDSERLSPALEFLTNSAPPVHSSPLNASYLYSFQDLQLYLVGGEKQVHAIVSEPEVLACPFIF